jgi:hypothetical protein
MSSNTSVFAHSDIDIHSFAIEIQGMFQGDLKYVNNHTYSLSSTKYNLTFEIETNTYFPLSSTGREEYRYILYAIKQDFVTVEDLQVQSSERNFGKGQLVFRMLQEHGKYPILLTWEFDQREVFEPSSNSL